MQSNTIMKFETGDHIYVGGTSLQGQIEIGYNQLVRILGEPTFETSGDGKVLAEWYLKFEDGTVATIYDWKNYGRKVEYITDWHIGGFNKTAVELVKEVLGNAVR